MQVIRVQISVGPFSFTRRGFFFYFSDGTCFPTPTSRRGAVRPLHTDGAGRCGDEPAASPLGPGDSARRWPSEAPGQARSDQACGTPSRGQKTQAAPTASCPARGLRTARLVTNCARVPVSKRVAVRAVTSLSSQGDSVLAFGSRVPGLDGKYRNVFRCPIYYSEY